MASRVSYLGYVAGLGFAVACLWASPAMTAAGFWGILVATLVALLAREARLMRTVTLASAIALVSIIQIVLLQLRVRSTLPFKVLWAFVVLVSAAVLVSYLIDRRRDA
jgi:hypothetical protein